MLPLTFALKRIYKNRKTNATINKRELKELIKFCTKDINFNFNGTTHAQNNGVAMCSPLTPVLAGILIEFRKSHYSKVITASSILEALC